MSRFGKTILAAISILSIFLFLTFHSKLWSSNNSSQSSSSISVLESQTKEIDQVIPRNEIPRVTFTLRQKEQESKNDSKLPFQTVLHRASADKTSPLCYYQVQNFCVTGTDSNGFTLDFFNPSSSSNNNNNNNIIIGTEFTTKKLRLCNELRRKYNLPFRQLVGENSVKENVVDRRKRRQAHIISCWQFYGYHLFQCSVAAFWAELLLSEKKRDDSASTQFDLWFYNHAVSLPKASRDHYSHKMFLGSDDSWLDGNFSSKSDHNQNGNKKRSASSNVLDAPLWGLWAVNAMSESSKQKNVITKELLSLSSPSAKRSDASLEEKTKSFCYEDGIIGQPVHHLVPNHVRVKHVERLKKLFLKNDSKINIHHHQNPKRKILISQRGFGSKQGSRKIANLDQILLNFGKSSSFLKEKFDVAVVDFAAMSFDEQLRIAHSSNILISTHGAGNIWLAFLSNFSTTTALFVELWPQEQVMRDVYQIMCKQYGVRYHAIFAKMKPLFSKPEEQKFSFLHQDVEVPWKELEEILRKE